jgi:hypothetical protein
MPMLGIVAFLDHNWSDEWSSAVGYSTFDNDNTERPGGRRLRQRPLRAGQPALLPGAERDVGGELQWATARTSTTASRRRLQGPVLVQVQLSHTLGGNVMSDASTRHGRAWLIGLAVARWRCCAAIASAQSPAEIQAALDAAYAKYKDLQEGKNADYIPALAKVDSEHLRHRARHDRRQGLHRGRRVKSEVSIQSISKVFTMAR